MNELRANDSTAATFSYSDNLGEGAEKLSCEFRFPATIAVPRSLPEKPER